MPRPEFDAEFGPPIDGEVCPCCGSSGDVDPVTLRRRPLSEHECRGPEPDPWEELARVGIGLPGGAHAYGWWRS